MKIGICDDVESERNYIKNICQEQGYNDLFLFTSGEELLQSNKFRELHLLFLDIEMKEIDGIKMKEILEQKSPSTLIVFCTAHSEIMSEAFGINVISFLQKPLSAHAIERSLKKVLHIIRFFTPISLESGISIPCHSILYLHAEQKYTTFYTLNGKSFLSRKSLKVWESELSELGFCCIHRAYIINLKYYVETQGKNALLSTGHEIPVSRRQTSHLQQNYDTFLLQEMRYE